jgi:digeranylgeranylglycerophospholipid reductase
MIRDRYDVVVVGGGPAGTLAARTAAEKGVSVLVLEKDRDLGIPVRCAEACGRKSLDRFLEPDPRWVAHQLDQVRFFAPDGNFVEVKTDEVGYILNRRIFDQELGRRAVRAGAQILTRAYVYGLTLNHTQVTGVKVKLPDRQREIAAKIVIAADGVESRVGRWAGLRTHFALKDLESCYQLVLGGITVNPASVDCYFGEKVAPGGYAWVFPKGEDIANVGIGVAASMTRGISPKAYLERFVEEHFPGASVLACVAGGVPAAKPFKQIHGAGILLAGDAAAHSNPLTGGGIISAMAAGRLAGEVAADCILKGDWSPAALSAYTLEWENRWGEEQRRHYRLKEAVHKLTDKTLNQAAQMLNKLPPEKRTMQNVFRVTLAHHPQLLFDIARSFLSS